MADATLNAQTEKFFVEPVRAYAGLVLEHFEKLTEAQFEATRNYAEAGLGQARAALDITDAKGFQAYVQGQQKFAKEIGERVQGDAEKFAALGRDFFEKSRKLTEDNVKSASKASTSK
jgi:phasin family protein